MSKYLLHLLVLGLSVVSCTRTDNLSQVKPTYKMRFQNRVSLELSRAGCSILNLGGLDRMCEVAQTSPADFVFQIGPAFTSEYEGGSPELLFSKRQFLWKEWEKRKVRFYAVSTEDLSPSLADFQTASTGGSIVRVSSNLKTPDGKHLFEPFYKVEFGKRPLVFLSFTDVPAPAGAPFQVADVAKEMAALKGRLPPVVTHYVVTGSLSPESRGKIAQASDKPVLFLGGLFTEANTIDIVPEGKAFFAKAPDIGRGYGEIEIGEVTGKSVQIGGVNYGYRARVLRSTDLKHPECIALNSGVASAEACVFATKGKQLSEKDGEIPCEAPEH